MWIKQVLLGVSGLAAGGLVAAGVFALITTIGVLPRLADKSRTASNVKTYESAVLWGGVWGNVVSIFDIPMPFSWPSLIVFGLFSGIFVGCLATSLAESLKTTSVFSRRMRLHRGMGAIVLSIALGKAIASIMFFYLRWYN